MECKLEMWLWQTSNTTHSYIQLVVKNSTILKYLAWSLIGKWRCLNLCNRKRRQMQRDSVSSDPVNEKFLFHGTSRNAVDAICANNFDWRLCGSHGTVYGQGNFEVTARGLSLSASATDSCSQCWFTSEQAYHSCDIIVEFGSALSLPLLYVCVI